MKLFFIKDIVYLFELKNDHYKCFQVQHLQKYSSKKVSKPKNDVLSHLARLWLETYDHQRIIYI